ncbi:DUF547 domain-containing protein [Pedosphaera parvula]|uniref:DUF547 domain-containing protein n=1 Tax=Pedosphaera parvula (strain Ellin514) TaxID=320771 RepID=B9XJU6_PEDPL|nr:DUF547 domain-containing protein [Pedosphaera parvula]EEF59972.1 protein of unknown function DUF547 [Pedosphaera parvula Ellin514]
MRLFTILLLVLSLTEFVQAAEFDHSHQHFDRVLKQYVKNGLVNYAGLKTHPQELNSYLDQLASVPEDEFARWNENQQMAFLINLYNAATLRLIVDHYPVKSIKDIGGVLNGPWKQKVVHLWGETITLDDLEHGILRKRYAEPRVHFALVCAAHGCPPLREEAYTEKKLNEQLDDQGRRFIGNKEKNRVDVSAHVVYLSPIFKWYAQDFEKKGSPVLKWITPFFTKEEQAALTNGGEFKIRYTDYDWSLNDSSVGK